MQGYAKNFRQRTKHDSEINLTWIGNYNVFKDDIDGQRSKSQIRQAEEPQFNLSQQISEQKRNFSHISQKSQGGRVKQTLYGSNYEQNNEVQKSLKRSKSLDITRKISDSKPYTYQQNNDFPNSNGFGQLKRQQISMSDILNSGQLSARSNTQNKTERSKVLESSYQIRQRDKMSNIFNIENYLEGTRKNPVRERWQDILEREHQIRKQRKVKNFSNLFSSQIEAYYNQKPMQAQQEQQSPENVEQTSLQIGNVQAWTNQKRIADMSPARTRYIQQLLGPSNYEQHDTVQEQPIDRFQKAEVNSQKVKDFEVFYFDFNYNKMLDDIELKKKLPPDVQFIQLRTKADLFTNSSQGKLIVKMEKNRVQRFIRSMDQRIGMKLQVNSTANSDNKGLAKPILSKDNKAISKNCISDKVTASYGEAIRNLISKKNGSNASQKTLSTLDNKSNRSSYSQLSLNLTPNTQKNNYGRNHCEELISQKELDFHRPTPSKKGSLDVSIVSISKKKSVQNIKPVIAQQFKVKDYKKAIFKKLVARKK